MSFSYDFELNTADNGNVKKIINNLDANRTQNFTYDHLNRIATAYSNGPAWGSQYSIDIWGNMQASVLAAKNTGEYQPDASTEKNQLITYCYDAAGNVWKPSITSPPYCGAVLYSYDAENRLKTAGGVTYTYDGDGRRVKKSSGMLYWYDMGGNVIEETNLAGTLLDTYAFFNGQRVVRWGASAGDDHYYFSNHLGSATVITDEVGGNKEESDYYPYGGEIVISNTDGNRYKFTGKERDGESGLDYFIARHYSSASGRFLQADEFSGGPVDVFSSNDPLPPGPLPYADITNPQSLNKYSYTFNNPLSYTDPNGHDPRMVGAILGAGAGGAVILYKTGRAYFTGKGTIPDNKEIFSTLGGGLIAGAALGARSRPIDNPQPMQTPKDDPADTTPSQEPHDITVSRSKSPESARHIEDAQSNGQPSVVTLDRSGAAARRREATAGTETSEGMDRDEYPPACCQEGGRGASVRPVPSGDNRSAGAQMGNQTRTLPDGTKVRIKTTD